jgi:hypothetical protein
MVRGVHRKWKLPVAYYLIRGSTNASLLVRFLKEVLKACKKAGLRVVATVHDMGANNVRALKELGATIRQPYFKYRNQHIVTVYDPPHLLKCTRNLFHKYDVQFQSELMHNRLPFIAKWEHILNVYECDKQKIVRLLYKLTGAHLNPVGTFSVPLSTAIDIPMVLVEVDGVQRPFIIDTGASVCLIEPDILDAETTATNTVPVVITGDQLPLQGEQLIDFTLDGKVFHHRFSVGAVPAAAEGLLGTEFLAAHEARVDLANRKLHLRQSSNQGSHSLNQSSSQPEPWMIKTMETVRIVPRTNKIILGKLDLQKHQQNPQLVCVEPAHLPFKGLLVARGVSRLFRQARRIEQPREL